MIEATLFTRTRFQRPVLLLALALVAIAGAFALAASPVRAGGGCHGTPMTTGDGSTVETRGACFAPTVLRVEPGTTVEWVFTDGIAHTVTGAQGTWGKFDTLQPYGSVSYSFEAPGTYPYVCMLHPGMAGAVVVGDGKAAPPGSVSVQAVSAVAPGASRDPPQSSTNDGSGGIERWVIAVLALAIAAAGATGVVGYALGRRRAELVDE